MALWWIVQEVAGERRVYIQESSSSLYARISAAMSGLKQVVIELRELDAETARKIAKKDVGRVLCAQEAQRILEGL